MPPVNTPSNHSPPPTSSLQLNELSGPLPSLPASDDAHDDNVSFLRSRVRSPPDSSSSISSISRQHRRRQQTQPELDPMDLDILARRRSPIEINRRIPIVRNQRESPPNATPGSNPNLNHHGNSHNMPNYESRVSNPRSLYGWAPASDDDDDANDDANDDDLTYEPLQDPNSISSWFGRLSDRSAASRRHARREYVGRSPHALPDDPADNNGAHRWNDPTTEALLQSVRRQPRFSRTRTLHNYLLDRERAGTQDAEESRDRSSASRAYRFLPSSRGEPPRLLTHSDLRARISAHRQFNMDNPPSPRLKETIKYLDRLRYSNSFEESLTSAAAGGFAQLDFLPWDHDDFILDTASIAPPPMCSWLRPGMVFSGSQRAASSASSIFGQRVPSPSSSSHDPMVVNGGGENNNPNNNRISVYTTNGRRYLANNIYNLGTGKDENWPVKVTIHNINTQEMTLSGTMEAYNIPDKTSPSHDAHIVTFLEGEIIDFNTHTLETKNFKADAEIDSTYWRELQPFKTLTDEEMTRNLVSRKWITEELSKGWILMRWKERCFITPTDSRQGLTISGFYYISLHRESGHIEGLYYDPGSSPYQQLSLRPETKKMVRPSYSFR
ncbi:GID4/VID24 family protein [Aspergillus melleus]|uniref:GID4/VID24 family protein n=1 Tax=Aspergillus melleus TaxID=138277 RepID=UPI001E8DD6F8|nr:uncharacterized protein LDX57_000453 [Aspergillus melleus]KAH8422699.1 hypothetical protein LDX57_000453 [Aspergillus melleus]